MTYEEALKKWLVSIHGDFKVIYSKYSGFRSKIIKHESTIAEAIDLNEPVTLNFNYSEGYQYSEYTMEDARFDVSVEYRIRPDSFPDIKLNENDTYRRLELVSNEGFDLGNLIKQIVEVGNTVD